MAVKQARQLILHAYHDNRFIHTFSGKLGKRFCTVKGTFTNIFYFFMTMTKNWLLGSSDIQIFQGLLSCLYPYL